MAAMERVDASFDTTPLLADERAVNKDSHDDFDGEGSGTGTFVSAVFTTLNSAVGTGILTLPYAFRCAGVYGGTVMMIVFVLIELGTLNAIIKCAKASNKPTYPDIVRYYLGRKAAMVLAGVVAVYCFFASTAGFIIVKNVMGDTLLVASGGAKLWWTTKYFSCSCAAIIALPLLLLRDISNLQFTAMISACAVAYVTIVIVEDGVNTIASGKGAMNNGTQAPLEYWVWEPSALIAVPNIFLSLQCHIQVPSIFYGLNSSTKTVGKMTAAVGLAYFICMVLYLPIAIVGVGTFGHHTLPNIMECHYDAKAPTIIIARACLALTAILSLPINHFPAREALWSLTQTIRDKDERQRMPSSFFVIETLCFFGLSFIVGIVIPDLSTLNGLMGLSAGVAVIFILPALFLLKLTRLEIGQNRTNMSVMASYAYFIFGLLTMAAAVYDLIGTTLLTPKLAPAAPV